MDERDADGMREVRMTLWWIAVLLFVIACLLAAVVFGWAEVNVTPA